MLRDDPVGRSGGATDAVQVIPPTLITGGNRGLGLETARRLVEAGHTVYAGMRDPAGGDAARALGAQVIRMETVTEGTDAIVALATIDQDGPTGEFHNSTGRIVY